MAAPGRRSGAAGSTCPIRYGREGLRSGLASAPVRRRRAPDARRRRRAEKSGAGNECRAVRRSYGSSSHPELALGVEIERTPEYAIDDDDEQAHHGNAEHDAMKIAGVGLLGNIGAQPFGLQVL